MCVFVCMLIYDIICKLLDSLTERDLDLFMLKRSKSLSVKLSNNLQIIS